MENYLLPEGFTLRDKYSIVNVLGEGGFGITYLATDLVLDLDVCVKELYISGSSTRGQNMTV
jgi:serine/threonine protein kinase